MVSCVLKNNNNSKNNPHIRNFLLPASYKTLIKVFQPGAIGIYTSLLCLALDVPASAGQHTFPFGSLLLLLLLPHNLSLKVGGLQMTQNVMTSILFACVHGSAFNEQVWPMDTISAAGVCSKIASYGHCRCGCI